MISKFPEPSQGCRTLGVGGLLVILCSSLLASELVDLELVLPKPVFNGTPKNLPPGTNLEKPSKKPRPPLKVPNRVVNLALELEVDSSDEEPIIGELDLVTDGDKEAMDGSYVELGPGQQYVQIDLGTICQIFAVVIWHEHGQPKVYRDVIIQGALDEDFIKGVELFYNNDHDNSSGLGLGKEKEYFETYKGRVISVEGRKARYVRFYSNGNTADEMNRYTEIEIYGIKVQ